MKLRTFYYIGDECDKCEKFLTGDNNDSGFWVSEDGKKSFCYICFDNLKDEALVVALENDDHLSEENRS